MTVQRCGRRYLVMITIINGGSTSLVGRPVHEHFLSRTSMHAARSLAGLRSDVCAEEERRVVELWSLTNAWLAAWWPAACSYNMDSLCGSGVARAQKGRNSPSGNQDLPSLLANSRVERRRTDDFMPNVPISCLPPSRADPEVQGLIRIGGQKGQQNGSDK